MRTQLIQYVNLLFAGAPDSEEIKDEILQNTLDRYDDLVSQGKSPEAAYRLAISGIGDINEILGNTPKAEEPSYSHYHAEPAPAETDTPAKKLLRAVAIALYILCPTPLFILSEMGMDTIGLCGTLAIVAVATVLIILGKKPGEDERRKEESRIPLTPKQELHRSIRYMINAITLVLYLIISFATGAWYITWLIFPISACVQGLVRAILDLKEACSYEN